MASYPYRDEIQYELYIQDDSIVGDLKATPRTKLTRIASPVGPTGQYKADVTTITVESTIGFPASGVIYIGSEGIKYESKSVNQFFGCKRGYRGVATTHNVDETVYGDVILSATTQLDGVTYQSQSWVLGLVESVEVVDPGVLHSIDDRVFVDGPGRVDPREPMLASFLENYEEDLVSQAKLPPEMGYVEEITAGVASVYFDESLVYVGTSGLPILYNWHF